MINIFLSFIFSVIRNFRILLFKVLSTQTIEGPVNVIQAIQVVGKGRIIVAKNVNFGYFPSPHFFSSYCYLESRSKNAIIKIGENTYINNGFVAIAEQSSITIGNDCLIGTHVEIYDSDFHALSKIDRKNGLKHLAKDVNIGNYVFIGSNVKILKGVTIGDGAVVANSSVVTKNIEPNVIAAGNPAVTIKVLNADG